MWETPDRSEASPKLMAAVYREQQGRKRGHGKTFSLPNSKAS